MLDLERVVAAQGRRIAELESKIIVARSHHGTALERQHKAEDELAAERRRLNYFVMTGQYELFFHEELEPTVDDWRKAIDLAMEGRNEIDRILANKP